MKECCLLAFSLPHAQIILIQCKIARLRIMFCTVCFSILYQLSMERVNHKFVHMTIRSWQSHSLYSSGNFRLCSVDCWRKLVLPFPCQLDTPTFILVTFWPISPAVHIIVSKHQESRQDEAQVSFFTWWKSSGYMGNFELEMLMVNPSIKLESLDGFW